MYMYIFIYRQRQRYLDEHDIQYNIICQDATANQREAKPGKSKGERHC